MVMMKGERIRGEVGDKKKGRDKIFVCFCGIFSVMFKCLPEAAGAKRSD